MKNRSLKFIKEFVIAWLLFLSFFGSMFLSRIVFNNNPAIAGQVEDEAHTQEIKIKDVVKENEVSATDIPPDTLQTQAEIIDAYLASKGSPMEGVGSTCIASEERWGVPCSWLIAIAGYESGFGTKGYAVGTSNAWGWNIHNGQSFGSWGLGMEAVAQGLKSGYLDRGANDLWTIGQYYCHSNSDGNGPEHSWANGVYDIEQDFLNYML